MQGDATLGTDRAIGQFRARIDTIEANGDCYEHPATGQGITGKNG